MTRAEQIIIERYAAGEHPLKEEAIAIYRRHVGDAGSKNGPHMHFMAEVDNAAPDFGLRAQYRHDVNAFASRFGTQKQ